MDLPLLQYLPRDERHEFKVPVKRIHEGKDVSHFLTSKAYRDIMTLLLQLNRVMFPSKTLSSETNLPRVQIWQKFDIPKGGPVWNIQALLKDLDSIIDQVPLDTGPRRFGNVSFRKWYQKVEEQTTGLLTKWLQLSSSETAEVTSADEITPYFLGSFGSAQRLDYGSGHELSFLAFLGCIWKLNGFADVESGEGDLSQDDQARAIVLGPMQDYFQLIRRLIKTYTLEPAGSHGVWGLDDHSFIPYVFGSAQYGPAIGDADDTPIEGSLEGAPDPADVAQITAVNRHRESNMYFGAIGFIHDVKTGPFWEHSPMLYDISGVKSGWGKINKGMIKMYNAEVLSKFPVVQHFPFGSLFSWDTDPNAPTSTTTSIHTSSQPFSLSNNAVKSTSTEKVTPARPVPSWEGGVRAPWANTPTTTGIPPRTTRGVPGYEASAQFRPPGLRPDPRTPSSKIDPGPEKGAEMPVAPSEVPFGPKSEHSTPAAAAPLPPAQAQAQTRAPWAQ